MVLFVLDAVFCLLQLIYLDDLIQTYFSRNESNRDSELALSHFVKLVASFNRFKLQDIENVSLNLIL